MMQKENQYWIKITLLSAKHLSKCYRCIIILTPHKAPCEPVLTTPPHFVDEQNKAQRE